MTSTAQSVLSLPFIERSLSHNFRSLFLNEVSSLKSSREERQLIIHGILAIRDRIGQVKGSSPLLAALQRVSSPDFTFPLQPGEADETTFEERCKKFAKSAPYEEIILLDSVFYTCHMDDEDNPLGVDRLLRSIRKVIDAKN